MRDEGMFFRHSPPFYSVVPVTKETEGKVDEQHGWHWELYEDLEDAKGAASDNAWNQKEDHDDFLGMAVYEFKPGKLMHFEPVVEELPTRDNTRACAVHFHNTLRSAATAPGVEPQYRAKVKEACAATYKMLMEDGSPEALKIAKIWDLDHAWTEEDY